MTCQDFELAAVDLAAGRAESPDAVAHVAGCAGCSGMLEAQRAVTAELRLLATSAPAGAPQAVEDRLLAAFREIHPAAFGSQAGGAVVPIRRNRVVIGTWVAAAAVATLFAGTVALRAWMGAAPAAAPETASAAARPSTPGVQPPVPPAIVEQPVTPVSTGVRHGVRSTQRAPRPAVSPAADQPYEIATEFYPLVGTAGQLALESGRIVRVSVPRASLAAMGFNVNVERIDQPVAADVLLGHDGVARAIRFVHTSSDRNER